MSASADFGRCDLFRIFYGSFPNLSFVAVDIERLFDYDEVMSTALSLLQAQIAEYDELDDVALEQELRALDLELRQREARFAVALHIAHRRRLGRRDGYRSLTAWQRGELNASPTQTRHRNHLAATITQAPVVVDALLSGRIGVTQAQLLAEAATHPRAGQQFAAAADHLVEMATTQAHGDFHHTVRHWRMQADPEGATRAAERAHRRRWCKIGIADELGYLEGRGGLTDTVEMREILDRFTQLEFEKDWEICSAQFGEAASPDLMARTQPQRRWDALHRIFLQAAATPAGAQLPVPTLNIMMDLTTYESTLTRMRLIPGQLANSLYELDPINPRDRRCHTSDGIAIEPTEALARCLHGHIRRVVFDSPSLVTDLGRRQRFFTGAARDAVALQATHCVWPGCKVASSHCQHDHLRSWSSGGSTSPANGVPLCARHNRHKSRGYEVGRSPTGTWQVTRPDGQPLGIYSANRSSSDPGRSTGREGAGSSATRSAGSAKAAYPSVSS